MAKQKLSQRIWNRFFGETPRTHKRRYAAAKVNRQNADWETRPMSANWEHRQSIFILRARARQMARDNSHFKKYLSMARGNVIGPKGIQLQSKARKLDGKLDVKLNKQVEEAFWVWSHRETCTLSTKLDWLGVQRLVVQHLFRDGEFLVRKFAADNEFGFSLKVINVDYLDEMYNDTLSNGNRVIMSVEIDADDRPVGYWLTTPASDIMFSRDRTRRRVRVPAAEMIHGFLIFDDESQVRGITSFHAAMLDGKNYEGYNTGVIQQARMASNQVGFLVRKTPDEDGSFTGVEDADGNVQAAEIDVSPLSMNELPAGVELQQFDPKQPTQNHAAFAKTITGKIAAGLEVPYFDLSGDMEAVNFSSSRVGLDASRDNWRGIQDFVSSMLCREVFHSWARAAFLGGRLKMTPRQFQEIQNPTWRGRGWKYIDPTKDVAAAVTALENNLTTVTDELGEQGIDLIDLLETRKAELELGKEYGIDLMPVSSVKATENEPPPDEAKPAEKGKKAAA